MPGGARPRRGRSALEPQPALVLQAHGRLDGLVPGGAARAGPRRARRHGTPVPRGRVHDEPGAPVPRGARPARRRPGNRGRAIPAVVGGAARRDVRLRRLRAERQGRAPELARPVRRGGGGGRTGAGRHVQLHRAAPSHPDPAAAALCPHRTVRGRGECAPPGVPGDPPQPGAAAGAGRPPRVLRADREPRPRAGPRRAAPRLAGNAADAVRGAGVRRRGRADAAAGRRGRARRRAGAPCRGRDHGRRAARRAERARAGRGRAVRRAQRHDRADRPDPRDACRRAAGRAPAAVGNCRPRPGSRARRFPAGIPGGAGRSRRTRSTAGPPGGGGLGPVRRAVPRTVGDAAGAAGVRRRRRRGAHRPRSRQPRLRARGGAVRGSRRRRRGGNRAGQGTPAFPRWPKTGRTRPKSWKRRRRGSRPSARPPTTAGPCCAWRPSTTPGRISTPPGKSSTAPRSRRATRPSWPGPGWSAGPSSRPTPATCRARSPSPPGRR